MNNTTKSTNTTNRIFEEKIWIADVIVVGFLGLLSAYVICALFFYQMKVKEKRNSLSKEARLKSTTKKISISVAFVSLSYNLFSISALAVERFVSEGREVKIYSQLQMACQILRRLEILNIVIGTGLVYLFLWCRQRVFYINPSLTALNSNKVKIISYLVLALWVCYFVPAAVTYCVIIRYELLQPGGCQVVKKSLSEYKDIIISWVSVSTFMQITLLGLFVNPIINRMLIRGQTPSKPSLQRNSSNKLLRRVKRAFVLTLMCLSSDILAATVTVLTFRLNANNLILSYNVNMFINLLAIVGCFDNWAVLLWPWTDRTVWASATDSGRIEVTPTHQLSNRKNTSSSVLEHSSKEPSK